ncbi:sensor domain-containing diguanylate cyclase [Candidatus Woesearchaeota archaeon]|nr:sensor domain-containing diguanylate cyclase [Candidatus Woesearchaeota archaeon]
MTFPKINVPLWNSLCERFVSLTHGALNTLEKTGAGIFASGLLPDTCTLTCMKECVYALPPHTIHACEHNTRHLTIPLYKEGIKIGYLVLSYPGEITVAHQTLTTTLAGLLQDVCIQDDKDALFAALKHSATFLPTILHANTISAVCKSAVNYLVHALSLANCMIITPTERIRYNNTSHLEPMITSVEQRAYAHVCQSKTPFLIQHPAKDVLTADIPNISQHPHSLAAIPLIHDRTFHGCLLSAYDTPLNTDLLCTLAQHLSLALHVARQYTTATDKAQTDPLTSLANRSALMEALTTALPDAKLNNQPTSLAIIDIDDFKLYNDANGHLQGDQLLCGLARLMQDTMQTKHVYRFGGEEFVLLFPRTSQHQAHDTCLKLLDTTRTQLGITISIGIATCQNSSLGARELISEADKALYRAKNTGKNKIVHALIVDRNLGVIDVDMAGSMGKYS